MKATTNSDGTTKGTLEATDRRKLASAVDVLKEIAFKMDTPDVADTADLAKDGMITLRAILADPKLTEEN